VQTIATIGLDIAKSVFQVHEEATGLVVVRRQLKRRHVQAFSRSCRHASLALKLVPPR
jgi:transposase